MVLFFILLVLISGFSIWVSSGEPFPAASLTVSFFFGFLSFSGLLSNENPIGLSDPIPVETSEEGLEIFNGEYIVYDNSSGIRETKKFSSFEITKENGAPFIKEVQYDKNKYWYRLNFTPENHFKLYIPENTQFKLIEPQG